MPEYNQKLKEVAKYSTPFLGSNQNSPRQNFYTKKQKHYALTTRSDFGETKCEPNNKEIVLALTGIVAPTKKTDSDRETYLKASLEMTKQSNY